MSRFRLPALAGLSQREVPDEEATIDIDLVDRAGKELVREAVITRGVRSNDLQQLEPELERPVNAAFARYPVAPLAAPG